MTHVLCVIPVRGGSKGIPGKNAWVIAGKPLVQWTIEQALACRDSLAPQVELSVVVSTDDPALAEIARTAGAEAPGLRPPELARDDTPTEPVIVHAIDQAITAGRRPDAVMLLQATSPVRLDGTLERAVQQFHRTGVDSLIGVVAQTPFLWRQGNQGEDVRAHYPVDARPRRQDLAPADLFYRETGSLYLTRTELYLEQHNRIGGDVGLFVMDEVEGVDIDTMVDLHIADELLRQVHGTPTPPAAVPTPVPGHAP